MAKTRKARGATAQQDVSCCECSSSDSIMYLHPRCHTGQGLEASIDRDDLTIDISCLVCEDPVCSLPISIGPGFVAPEQACHKQAGMEIALDQSKGVLLVACRACKTHIGHLNLAVELDS